MCNFKEEKVHVKTSEEVQRSTEDCLQTAEYILQGALGTEPEQAGSDSQQFLTHVVKRFHIDEISQAVKNDALLLLFGKIQLRKLGLQRAAQVREKLRILGRIKLELRALTHQESAHLSDFIKPSKFDICMTAIGNICGESTEGSTTGSKTYTKPSLALKAGQLLKKMAVLKRGQAIRKLEIAVKDETDQFVTLYNGEFSAIVSSLAHHTLSERKYNKKVLLPLTEDLLKYVEYLETTTVENTVLLLDCPCPNHWTALADVTVARVILFNKRRASEGSKMLTSQFINRPSWGNENKELVETLTPVEKHLLKTMSLVEVVGKQYKRVPVLLTKTMVAAIQALVNTRAKGGVKHCNPHVFAQGDSNFRRGSDCVRRTVQACELKCPERITSTKLRKYLATVSQVFNLSESELGELARHMGHELSVHRRFYRLQDDVIELAKVSRLLLSVEEGKAAQFAGKSLDDINLEDFGEIEVNEEDDDEDAADDDLDLQSYEDEESAAPSSKKRTAKVLQSDEDEESATPPLKKRIAQVLQSDEDDESSAPSSKRKTARVSKRDWSQVEKVQIKHLVEEAVKNKRPPRKGEIVMFQATKADKNLTALPWVKIKHQVWAMAQVKMKEAKKIVNDLLP